MKLPTFFKSVSSLFALLFVLTANAQIDPPTVSGRTNVCLGSSTELTASLNGQDETNIEYVWYSQGLLGPVEVFRGNPFNTGILLLNATYFVEAENTVTLEVSPRTEINLVVSSLPNVDVPVALPADLILCKGDSTTITATSIVGNTEFVWYDALLGGNKLFEGNPYNTGAIDIITPIYVASVNSAGCESPRVLAPALTLIPALDVPVVVPPVETICSGDSVELTATTLLGGTQINWYDTLLGGTPIATGTTFNTGAIENEGAIDLVHTFYAEVVDGNGCRSLRTPAVITTLPALDVPIATPPVDIVCAGDSAQFIASSLLGSVDFTWYDAIVGGNVLHQGDTFNTGQIDNQGAVDLTEIYYVEAEDVNGCKSLRTPATLVVTPALDLPIVDPVIATACSGEEVTFNVSSLVSGGTFYWYDQLVGGNPIDTGVTVSFTNTNSTATELTDIYYVEVVDANGCKSLRVPATVISLPLLDAPLANPPLATICSGDSVTFTATALLGASKFNWYSDINSGTPIDTGIEFNTGAINNSGALDLTQIYYLEAEDDNGCKSLRTPVTVLITPALEVPLANPLIDTVCNGGSAEFVASSLLGSSVEYRWYETIDGDTPVHVGDTFNTPNINNASNIQILKLYYLEAVDQNGCTSLRTPVTAVVLPLLDVPLVDPLIDTICTGGSPVFTASTLLGQGVQFRWYDAFIGGNLLRTGNPFSPGPIINNGTLDLTRTYYVEAVDERGCTSLRTPATTVILPELDVVLVNPLVDTVCSGGSQEFTASALLGEMDEYYWYDNISGGNLLDSGSTFNTGPIVNNNVLNLTRTYYVEGKNSNGCRTVRTPAIVVVLPAIDLPIVNPLIDTVCNGGQAQFAADLLLNDAKTFRWYESLLASDPVFVGDTFVTDPIINQGATNLLKLYYVEGETEDGCRTARLPVTALVLPALDLPLVTPITDIVCSGQTSEFIASSLLGTGVKYNWYDQAFGGNLLFEGDTFVTPEANNSSTLDLTRIYFVELENENGCKSLRLPVTQIIQPKLDLAIATPPLQITCNGDSVEFVGTSLIPGDKEFFWYDELLEGNLLHVGDTFNTGEIQNTGTLDLTRIYYLEVQDSAGCRSLRTPATVVIRPALEVPLADPLVAIACNGQSETFTASSLLGQAVDFNWYDNIVGGTLLHTGDTFVSPEVVNNGPTDLLTTYYVEAVDTAGCKSLRTPVVLTTLPAIDVPLATPLISTICSGDSLEFTATSLLNPDADFRWYDDLLQGNLLAEGDTFNTGRIINNGTLDLTRLYYVEAVDSNGCASVRTPVTAIILPALDVPTPSPIIQTVCNGQTAEIVGGSLLGFGNATYRWYDALIGGNLLAVGDTFSTEILSNSTTDNLINIFYLEVEDTNGCKSLRVPATVIVRPGIDVAIVNPAVNIICNGESVTLTATSLTGQDVDFEWYDALIGGTQLAKGDTFNTGPLQNNTGVDIVRTFYVESVDSLGCRSVRTPSIVTILPGPVAPNVTPDDTTVCSGSSVNLKASSDQGSRFKWYESQFGGPVIAEGSEFNTGSLNFDNTITFTKSYYVAYVDSAGCESNRAEAEIEVRGNPDTVLFSPSSPRVCEGNSIALTANSQIGNSRIQWFATETSTNPIFNGSTYTTEELNAQTTFYVTTFDEFVCPSKRFSITVEIDEITPLDAPQVSCGNEDSVDVGQVLFVWNDVEGADSYEISTDDGQTWQLPSSGPTGTSHVEFQTDTTLSEVTILVRGINTSADCRPMEGMVSGAQTCSFKEGEPKIEDEDEIEVYNSFTPNNDGVNDVWGGFAGIEKFPDSEILVVNRWGKPVYEAEGYGIGNEFFTGEDLEDGAYFYVIKIPSQDVELTGYVMIIR